MKNALIAFALAATLSWLSLEGQPRQSAKPLTEPELADLLKNFVPSGRVAELAREKGIDFTLSLQQEQELRRVGADDALLNALRELAPKPLPPAPVVPKLSAGAIRPNPKDGQRYAYIPPGSFLMGCSTGDSECFDNEKPQHRVTLTKAFWIGQTAVTVAAWKRYRIATGTAALPTEDNVGRKNWNEAGDENMPAVAMTWDEAKSYCEWASMRLPTEAEWEYAARAGTTTARYGDLDSIAWYGDNSGSQRIHSTALWKQDPKTYAQKLHENGNFVHAVALKQPNAWKLYDMLGNVYAWTADWYDAGYYAKSESENPLGPPVGQ
ncbi:MAG: formylglycine-generating enzyme family protein, partial [Bryobacteraceae bacterium]